MADKETKLSIVIRAVDRATTVINAITARLEAATKPLKNVRKALDGLREASGLDAVAEGFAGVGGALSDVLGRLTIVGGLIGAATAGLFHLVDGFDNLGDKAEALGVGVDFLAQTRFAAERAGAAAENLDNGMRGFVSALGEARANKGPLVEFLNVVSPALLRQLQAAKGNEEAFLLLADAMAKLEDPAKRAALAQKTLGDASLAPLLAKGSAGIKELQARYLELAGSQAGAAGEAGKVDDAMKDLKASTDGIKAALVEGLAPALGIVVNLLREFFTANRGAIKEWAADLGKRLPGAISATVAGIREAFAVISSVFERIGGLRTVLIAIGAIIAGPLVSAIGALGAALLATPVGWIVAGIAAITAGVVLLIRHWGDILDAMGPVGDMFRAIGRLVASVAKLIVAVFSPVAAVLKAAWEPLGIFFSGLWGAITDAFKLAWSIIEPIVEAITSAVDDIKGAIDTVTGAVGGSALQAAARAVGGQTAGAAGGGNPISALAAQSQQILRGGPAQEARVTVDFANAPRGTRVNADPQSTAAVDLTVGYQMLGVGS